MSAEHEALARSLERDIIEMRQREMDYHEAWDHDAASAAQRQWKMLEAALRLVLHANKAAHGCDLSGATVREIERCSPGDCPFCQRGPDGRALRCTCNPTGPVELPETIDAKQPDWCPRPVIFLRR